MSGTWIEGTCCSGYSNCTHKPHDRGDMTQKTAKEWANGEFENWYETENEEWLDPDAIERLKNRIEQAILQYSSSLQTRLREVEAENERLKGEAEVRAAASQDRFNELFNVRAELEAVGKENRRLKEIGIVEPTHMSAREIAYVDNLKAELSRLTTTNLELVERERRLREALQKMSDAWDGLIGLIVQTHRHDAVFECNCAICKDVHTACNNVKFCRELLITPPSELGKRVEKVIEAARQQVFALKELTKHGDEPLLLDNLKVLVNALTNLDALLGGTK